MHVLNFFAVEQHACGEPVDLTKSWTRMLHIKSVWSVQTFAVHKVLSFSANPRWLPNCVTYIVPGTLASRGSQGYFTMPLWPCCRQVLLTYGPCLVFRKSKMATKLHDLHSTWHTCMWGTTRLLHHISLNIVQATITELWAMLSYQEGNSTYWKFARIIFSQFWKKKNLVILSY